LQSNSRITVHHEARTQLGPAQRACAQRPAHRSAPARRDLILERGGAGREYTFPALGIHRGVAGPPTGSGLN
jgi:hypothetical protein